MEVQVWVLWVIGAVLLAILELMTQNLVCVWFIGGCLAGVVTDLLGWNVWLQFLAFVVVSALLVAAIRPFVKKFVMPKITPTNADTILGKEAYLTEGVNNLMGMGALRLEGKEWSVRSATGEPLPEGTLVRIVGLEGVKVLVERVPVPTEV